MTIYVSMHRGICVKISKFNEKNGMKGIRHAEVGSRMIILDDQARQQMTCHFQLSLHCNVLSVCLTKPMIGKLLLNIH